MIGPWRTNQKALSGKLLPECQNIGNAIKSPLLPNFLIMLAK